MACPTGTFYLADILMIKSQKSSAGGQWTCHLLWLIWSCIKLSPKGPFFFLPTMVISFLWKIHMVYLFDVVNIMLFNTFLINWVLFLLFLISWEIEIILNMFSLWQFLLVGLLPTTYLFFFFFSWFPCQHCSKSIFNLRRGYFVL